MLQHDKKRALLNLEKERMHTFFPEINPTLHALHGALQDGLLCITSF